MKLDRTEETFLDGQAEYWNLKNEFVVRVSLEEEICTMYIFNTRNGVTAELISTFLKAKEIQHRLVSTINSWGIEVEIGLKEET